MGEKYRLDTVAGKATKVCEPGRSDLDALAAKDAEIERLREPLRMLYRAYLFGLYDEHPVWGVVAEALGEDETAAIKKDLTFTETLSPAPETRQDRRSGLPRHQTRAVGQRRY